MTKEPLYRLEVAPLTIIPLKRSPFFTYASPAPISKGSLVSISFGTQILEGIVFECEALAGTKPTWMKRISHVIHEAFLTEEQCALAIAVSREYFTPLGRTLRHFLPKRVKARTSMTQGHAHHASVPRPTKEEKILLDAFLASSPPASIDLSYVTDPKKLWTLIARESQKEKKQLLILVPEITLIYPLEERLRSSFGDVVTTLHSHLASGAFFASWEQIRDGRARIIIATRQGLFAPFSSLGTVIITEEQDDSYKQWDMSPRYHGKRVATMLASLHQARVLFASGTPSTEMIFQRQHESHTALTPIMTHPPLGNILSIVNLKLERYRRNFSPLSEALVQAIRETLGRKEQVLLYINRQGMHAFSVCAHCKSTLRCKRCEHPLGSTRDGSFRCASCGYTTPLFPSCPSCGHLSFRHIGFGTEKVEREVQKIFPHACVARLDSSILKNRATLKNIIADGMHNKIDILIGTQMVLKDPPLPKLTLIAMIDADSLLLFPHFRADERLFQDLSRAVHQVTIHADRPPSGAILLQTFHPESAFLHKITTLSSATFLNAILADRKELFYPPYARLLTLTCQGKTEKDVRDKEDRIVTMLKESLPHNCRLRASLPIRFLKKKNHFESDILLRFPSTETFIPDQIHTVLMQISGDCIIDVDPLFQSS